MHNAGPLEWLILIGFSIGSVIAVLVAISLLGRAARREEHLRRPLIGSLPLSFGERSSCGACREPLRYRVHDWECPR